MSFQPGQYQALGVEIGHKFLPSGAPVTQVHMLLGRIWAPIDQKWVKLATPQPFTGEWFLYKSSGEVSDHRWKMFQDVLGWDGVDLASLQQLDISKKYFNVTLAKKEGSQYVEASWINPLGDPVFGAKKVEKAPLDRLKAFGVRGAPAAADVPPDNIPF